jgi:toxin ParE1/3/4
LAQYRLSHRAEDDFLAILTYTLRTWSRSQAEQYIDRIESCCELLAKNPGIGRECGWLAPGLRRVEEGRHVIFYRQDLEGIKIVRVLHQNMLPFRQMMKKDENP